MTSTATTTNVPGVLEHLDPQTLLIETNVRTEHTLTAEFIDSVRDNGVLTPVLAWRDPDGAVHVRAGQRRTLAAREAACPTIPVYVVDSDHTDTATRLIEQLVENDQRAALTDFERTAAWQQLAFEGLNVATIARRTGSPRDHIAAGITVAASSVATSLLGQVTLDQAATLTEFEAEPAVLAELTQIATDEPDYFPVAVQRARDDAATRNRVHDVETTEAARGHRVLTERPRWGEAPHPLHHVLTADGSPITPEQILGRDGVAVLVTAAPWRDDDPIQVTYYLDDPAALGYAVPTPPTGITTAEPHTGPMTEEQKAERRLLIARNKEWDAATTVRRDWLTQFIARKTLPKEATRVLAVALTNGRGLVAESMTQGSQVAATLLGLTPTAYGSTALADYLEQHPARALHVALAIALGGIEQTLSRATWRTPTTPPARYLAALAAWGYPLCPVERIAAMVEVEVDGTD